MRLEFHGVVGEVTTMPGCSQVAISHAVYNTNPGSHRGQEANVKRLAALKRLGYDYVTCTVVDTNTAQLRIMDKNRWTWLSSFVSRKTGNQIRLYGKKLL